MISVQATRQSTVDTKPNRESYDEQEDRRGRFVPLIFLLMVGSCVAYLKSFLPGKLDAAHGHEAPRADADDTQSVKDDSLVVRSDDDPVVPSEKPLEKAEAIRISAPPEGDSTTVGSTDPSAQSRVSRPALHTGSTSEATKEFGEGRSQHHQAAEGGGGRGGGGGGGGGNGDGYGRGDTQPTPKEPKGPRDPIQPSTDQRNRAPRLTGPVRLPDVVGCNTLAITMTALLVGATDPDGDLLIVTGVSSSSGILTRTEDGGWTFEGNPGLLGEVRLTYEISDGTNAVIQTASFNVVENPPIIGSEDDDNLLGTRCADTIVALGGDDNVDAREGNDRILGGDGADHILAGPGNDVVYAGAGDDIVFAGPGNDVVFGGSGNDSLFGEAGDDSLMGEQGDDQLEGGAGRDILVAGAGNDVLKGDQDDDTLDGGDGSDEMAGGTGNDVMIGGAGNDVIAGDAGNDTIFDGEGSDIVTGGDGDDRVVASADAADDSLSGGNGTDTLDYSATTLTVNIDLRHGTAESIEIGRDLIESFEKIVAGSGDDRIIAGSGSVTLTGGQGRDSFEFERNPDEKTAPDVVRKITDFTVGDRIVAASYVIKLADDDDPVEEQIADLFEQVYMDEDHSGHGQGVRFRFEEVEGLKYTAIDVADRPEQDDVMTIEVAGYQTLQYAAIHH
jgi:Ca2+-binding RTX toxin-like protein